MRDLTHGPVFRHLVSLSVPIAVGMLLQTLYFLIDLYFVSALGDAAIAGVSAAGNVVFLVFALTQALSVATTTLVSHAVGRKDRAEANHIFNQSVVIAALLAVATLAGGNWLAGRYMALLGADPATRAAGVTYLRWFLPSLALQFAVASMGAALRGTGIVKPGMVVQMIGVLLNAALAPVLIAGWGTGHPLGVAGAGLASSLAAAAGVLLLTAYFVRLEKYVQFHPREWRPRLATWARMLNLGTPAGGEFALMAVIIGAIYWIIRDFGAAAQAGLGIGSRVMQSIFLPAMAIAFAVPALAGQNFGARHFARVRETFRVAMAANVLVMASLTLLCQWKAEAMVRAFTRDPAVIAVGAGYLHVISWNFVAVALVFTCSALFQSLGNTWPSLLSKSVRLLTFVLPAIWLSHRAGFDLEDVWLLSVASVLLEAVTSYCLLRIEMRARLGVAGAHGNPPDGIPATKARS
ncbi:MAG TPA: MATE family efflux transporter [Usitatibacter sp.]|nr:MATE family efflux transporter [Usitatibacter sp.]